MTKQSADLFRNLDGLRISNFCFFTVGSFRDSQELKTTKRKVCEIQVVAKGGNVIAGEHTDRVIATMIFTILMPAFFTSAQPVFRAPCTYRREVS